MLFDLTDLVFTPTMMDAARGPLGNFSSVSTPQGVTRMVGCVQA